MYSSREDRDTSVARVGAVLPVLQVMFFFYTISADVDWE